MVPLKFGLFVAHMLHIDTIFVVVKRPHFVLFIDGNAGAFEQPISVASEIFLIVPQAPNTKQLHLVFIEHPYFETAHIVDYHSQSNGFIITEHSMEPSSI